MYPDKACDRSCVDAARVKVVGSRSHDTCEIRLSMRLRQSCFGHLQPTKSPMTTAVDFMMGLPNLSQEMIVTNTRKPRPTNSAEPQGNGCGAEFDGQFMKSPVVGRVMHRPEPPAQFENPVPIRDTPIRQTVGPVTRGGKIRFSALGGMKLRRISRRAAQEEVPRRAP